LLYILLTNPCDAYFYRTFIIFENISIVFRAGFNKLLLSKTDAERVFEIQINKEAKIGLQLSLE